MNYKVENRRNPGNSKMKPLLISLFIFLLQVPLHAGKWDKNTRDKTRELLEKIETLINIRSFRDKLTIHLSFSANNNIFTRTDHIIKNFKNKMNEPFSDEISLSLLEDFKLIIDYLIKCQTTVKAYTVKLVDETIDIPEENIMYFEGDPQKMRTIPFMEFWEPYDKTIEDLKKIYSKATKKTCILS